jgi:uncharacterized protein
MTRALPLPTVVSFIDCINRGDIDGLARLMAADHRLLVLDEPPVVGRQPNADAWRAYSASFPAYAIHPRRFAVDGERVAVLGATTGSHLRLPDDDELRESLIWLAVVRDGALQTWQLVTDTPERRGALGLDDAAHAPPSRGDASADDVIRLLDLAPHPEGGFFRETWRDAPSHGGRGSGTAIYFLLRAGDQHRWHRVDAVEIWHHYAGAPLELSIAGPEGRRVDRLGRDLAAGERPQIAIPAHAWQRARSLGAFTLVGCTVSPAFVFDRFELAPDGWDPAP